MTPLERRIANPIREWQLAKARIEELATRMIDIVIHSDDRPSKALRRAYRAARNRWVMAIRAKARFEGAPMPRGQRVYRAATRGSNQGENQ